MDFDVAKINSCFVDYQSFEYKLPIDGQDFIMYLEGWQIKEFHNFRRPLFNAERQEVKVKGILKANTIRVSYPGDSWETEKKSFEAFVLSLPDYIK